MRIAWDLQEEYESWTRKIEDLLPRQAFVKFTRHVPRLLRPFMPHIKTVKIRTVKVPKPKTTQEQIQKIKEYYAQELMKPLDQIEQVQAPVPEPLRKRKMPVG